MHPGNDNPAARERLNDLLEIQSSEWALDEQVREHNDLCEQYGQPHRRVVLLSADDLAQILHDHLKANGIELTVEVVDRVRSAIVAESSDDYLDELLKMACDGLRERAEATA